MGSKILEAGKRIWRDVKSYWIAGAVFALYFLIGRFFLHSLCPFVVLTGFPCPGCGMTRAVFAVLRGDFYAAWQLHPFAYVLILFALWFVVRRYWLGKEVKSLTIPALVVLAAMILFYVYRMVRFFPGDSPMSYYYGSILRQIYVFFVSLQ